MSVRLTRFWAVGALGIGVQLGVLWLLADVLGVHHAIATSAAVASAVVHNFLWHRVWTWGDRRGELTTRTAFVRFVAANGVISLVGNVVMTSALVSVAGVATLPANAAAIAACGLLNFVASDRIAFAASLRLPHQPVLRRD